MPETPRSGKRRRLEAAAQNSPTPNSRQVSARKSRRAVVDELDLYDDIDGALTLGSASRPKRGGGDDADEPLASGKRGRKSVRTEEEPALTPSRSQKKPKSGAVEEKGSGKQEPVYFSSLPGLRPKDLPATRRSRRGNDVFETMESEDLMEESNDIDNGVAYEDEDTAFTAAQQLLAEKAAAAGTPTKRKKKPPGRPSKQADNDVEMRDFQDKHAPLTNGKSQKKAWKQSSKVEGAEELLSEEDLVTTPYKGRQYKRKNRTVDEDDDPMELDEISKGHVATHTDTRPAKRAATSITKAVPKETSPGFTLLKSVALSKLSSRRPIPLTNLTSEYNKVHTLVSATVQSGESNSMLLIGARGSGKTTLINAALQDISRSSKDHFHTVRLNGFIQTDDKLALREIWRQLGREMEIEDEGENGPGKSYADTLTMLLALLSHADEIPGSTSGTENQVAKSVIFIMDEFDLFATHPRQTLLYNLLDIAQSRKAPIAVLGLTTRIDVTEALEKRVKSRFSHRYVHLPLPKGLGQFVEVGKAAMMIKAEEMTFEENTVLSEKGGDLDKWNKAVDQLFIDPIFQRQFISSIYHTTKSIPTLLSGLLIPTSTLTTFPSTAHYIQHAISLTAPDSNLSLLPTLSSLALSLLISAARLTIIHSTESLNFNLTYGEYVSLASKARINSAAAGQLASGSRLWGKDVARKEWERLVELGLIVHTGGVGEMCRVDVALEEIPGAAGEAVLGKVREKWCKQI